MDKWTPLQPSRPGGGPSSYASGGSGSLTSILRATNLTGGSTSAAQHPVRLPPPRLGAWIGPLPESLHLLIIAHLPVPDLPRVAQTSRAFGRLVSSDLAWEKRWNALGIEDEVPAGKRTFPF